MALTPEQRDWLRLILVPGVGTAYFIRLLARFQTAGHVLQASRAALEEVVGPSLARRISEYAGVAEVEAQERLMEPLGVRFISLEDPAYPVRLAEIYDPPLALFARGELYQADEQCVAIVGTRRPTPYGIHMAEKLAAELAARHVTVVSGMALGIDAAAHRGAIQAGGRTIAILGCGVDVLYPPQHAELMQQIATHGCVVSQFVMGTKPSAGHFPYRNRIISGMTLGTVVIEAPRNSGALITARQAAEQGREVFAVPGQVGTRTSEGPHALIRDGAKLVETAEDILVELPVSAAVRQPASPARQQPADESALGPPSAPPSAPAPKPRSVTTALEQDVLSVLAPSGSYVDEIAAACRISVSEALSSLTMLELKGLVRQYSGKRFAPV
jgi:DNA processing protein